jgi:hypothetical protein
LNLCIKEIALSRESIFFSFEKFVHILYLKTNFQDLRKLNMGLVGFFVEKINYFYNVCEMLIKVIENQNKRREKRNKRNV